MLQQCAPHGWLMPSLSQSLAAWRWQMAKFTKYKWRFYADNDITREVVDHLRAADMDVVWVAEVPELRKQKDDSFHYRRASQLRRYLLTDDMDFWNDQKFPIKDCPGLVLLTTSDRSIAKYLPVLLRKLIRDYNPLPEPLYLDGVKIKVSGEGIVIKMVDRDTQKVTTESWAWKDVA